MGHYQAREFVLDRTNKELTLQKLSVTHKSIFSFLTDQCNLYYDCNNDLLSSEPVIEEIAECRITTVCFVRSIQHKQTNQPTMRGIAWRKRNP